MMYPIDVAGERRRRRRIHTLPVRYIEVIQQETIREESICRETYPYSTTVPGSSGKGELGYDNA